MWLDKFKRIVIALLLVFFTAQAFAATTDLAVRFLDKANEAYEDGNIEDAYKYVNQALAVAKDADSQVDVLYFAQTVYKQKLLNLQKKYDDMALIDIKMNLEKYPNIENTAIKKLVKQIEQDQENKEKTAQKKVEQERFIRGGKRTIATIGLDDVVIVDSDDALLVAAKGKIQDVKKVAEFFKSRA